jgi:hypothetical protein
MVLTYKQKFNKKHGQPLNQSNSISKIARLSKISYRNAKKIFEKGEGAYYSNPSSVRKIVRSPQQWAYARLYASVSKGSKSSKIDKDLLK